MAWGASTSPSASTSAELAAGSRARRRPGRQVPACAGRYRCRGDGVVDEDDCDGGGGGEGVGVEDSAAGRGAVQEQRQLLAESLRVDGAGLAGRFGEPRRKGLLVVAGEYAGWVARVLDLDGRPDERTQGRV